MSASFFSRSLPSAKDPARPETRNDASPGPRHPFVADEKGGVAIMFSLIAVVLCLFVGAAVDFGRWAQARHQTIAAMDAAVLAGGRLLQLNEPVEAARAAALRYYIENTQGRTPVVDDTITFDAVDDNTAFAAMGNAYIETAFLSLAHIDRLPLLDTSKATFSKADLKTGGANNNPVEISLMLDVTGSMALLPNGRPDPAQRKIKDLKVAAKDLVDIVISDHPLANPVRIALVPFAEGVRLPAGMNAKVRATPGPDFTRTVAAWPKAISYTYKATDCVVERTGTNSYTDVGPGPGNYVRTLFNTTIAIYTAGKCGVTQKSEVVPLTNNKQLLIDRIENLELSGGTAGQVGTAWAWYALSPNWNTVWPAGSQASSYNSDTKKIAILMTDGEYNVAYDKDGVQSDMPGASSPVNGISRTQARTLCTNMKAKGIEVYTVGFALGGDQNAIATMNHCATDASKAYIADNGAQLREAFRDIALKISTLHLTQ